jgi:signal transduction histidine kinase
MQMAESIQQPATDPSSTELEQLATHLQALAEREKSHIARTLHDELGGLLTAAKMDLSWLQPRIKAPELQERLAQLGSVLDEAMDLKRRVVDDLRPSLLDHFGIATALRTHFNSVCTKAGLQSQVDITEDTETLSKDTAIVLFRILQEGLTNITRHAGASNVRLTIVRAIRPAPTAYYRVTLVDDGQGFDQDNAQSEDSHGLMGMRQRVRTLGGTLVIDSASGRGTTLTVHVPAQ